MIFAFPITEHDPLCWLAGCNRFGSSTTPTSMCYIEGSLVEANMTDDNSWVYVQSVRTENGAERFSLWEKFPSQGLRQKKVAQKHRGKWSWWLAGAWFVVVVVHLFTTTGIYKSWNTGAAVMGVSGGKIKLHVWTFVHLLFHYTAREWIPSVRFNTLGFLKQIAFLPDVVLSDREEMGWEVTTMQFRSFGKFPSDGGVRGCWIWIAHIIAAVYSWKILCCAILCRKVEWKLWKHFLMVCCMAVGVT